MGVLIALFNSLSFLLFGWDKLMACKGRRRIPERSLLLSAVCCGAVGAWVAMHLFHHKTRVSKFAVSVPILAVLQVAVFFIFA